VAVKSDVMPSKVEDTDSVHEMIETVCDEWHSAIQADLEHGVRWLNESASAEFASKYPQLCAFGHWLSELEMKLSSNEEG
jgi:hypothetical protein